MQGTSISKISRWLLILIGIFFALLIRIYFLPFESGDAYQYLIPWYDHIAANGLIKSLSQNFYNYNPPYIYLLGLTTYLKWLPKLTAIKLISVAFDFVMAAAAFKIISRTHLAPGWRWFAFFCTLFLPTVFVDSSLWGQCDAIYCAFLLWMIDSLLQERYIRAMLFFSLAFVFKVQAIFLAPILLLLLLQKKIPLYSLFIPVAIYLLGILPAWIAGRSIMDLLSIYFSQASTYSLLSMNGPNPFLLLTERKIYSTTWVLIGLLAAALFATAYIIYRWKFSKNFKPEMYLYDSALLAFFIPFLLPKMHERYFFLAALCLCLLVLLDRKFIWPAVVIQISSLFSYINFLFWTPWNLTHIALLINFLVALLLAVFYWQSIHKISSAPTMISTERP